MHGRVKTRSSAEENERKKKERAKKVAVYTASISKIFEKRKNGELDEEGLQISGQLLSANPDIYTLWSFRKEILLHLKDNLEEKKLKSIIDDELHLTEVCLRYNPKSYGTWHHRCWVLENMPFNSWKKEVNVCNKYLDLDERNFHVWDYRRFVVQNAEVDPKVELEYTTEKINTNFSNYSAWHYRSKLLPIVHPDPHLVRPIEESVHKKELEMVESAAFTDPNDQSAWFYLRWLLGRSKPKLCILQAKINDGIACINFNQNVNLDSLDIKALDFQKWNTTNGKSFDHTLISLMDKQTFFVGDEDIKISVKLKMEGSIMDSINLEKISQSCAEFKRPFCFDTNFSVGLAGVLKQQLSSCRQLLEFEPDSKWALLTSVYLMQAIDRKLYKGDTMKFLDRLMEVDYQRASYYSDLRSRYFIEYLLEDGCDNSLEFIFCGFKLTALYHTEYLMTFPKVDFSDNLLTNRSLPLLCDLQFCKVLDLSSNKITSFQGFPKMAFLKILSLANNELNSVDGLDELIDKNRNLKRLDLRNNPISKDCTLHSRVLGSIPNRNLEVIM